METVTIVTRPSGFFHDAEYREFEADKVTVLKDDRTISASCSACEWMPDDQIHVHATGEIIHGRILTGGQYGF